MLISKSDNHLTNLILKRPRPGCRKHILIHNGKSHFMSVLHLQITGKGIDSCKRTGLCMDISECGSVLHSVFQRSVYSGNRKGLIQFLKNIGL